MKHSLVMSDRYGEATMAATLHEDGHITAHSESTAAEGGSSSALAASVEGEPSSAHSPHEASAVALEGPATTPLAQAAYELEYLGDTTDSKASSSHIGSKPDSLLTQPGSPQAATSHGTSDSAEGSVQSSFGQESVHPEEESGLPTSAEGLTTGIAAEEPDDFVEEPSGDASTSHGERTSTFTARHATAEGTFVCENMILPLKRAKLGLSCVSLLCIKYRKG